MPTDRLRRRADFLAAATGPRARGDAFVVQMRRRDDNAPARVGFTVSRKVGNAILRNRARRRLREMVRLAPADALAPGHDYVLVARRPALNAGFDQLARDFTKALLRLSRTVQPHHLSNDNNTAGPAPGSDESR